MVNTVDSVEFLLQRYGINDEKLTAVRQYGKRIIPTITQVVNEFYSNLSSEPEFSVFFTNSEILDHVKAKQTQYWQQFFKAKVDKKYIKSRETVGRVHAEIGLPVRTYFRAMSRFIDLFTADLLYATEAERASDKFTLHCINSLALLDTSLAVDAIFHRHAEAFDVIAQGDYTYDYNPLTKEDIFGTALMRMTERLREMAAINERISQGDLSTVATVRGEKDLFAISMNGMLETQRNIAKLADQIAAGNYTVDLVPRGNVDPLFLALRRMIKNLEKLTRDKEDQLWLAQSLSGLSDQLRGNLIQDVIGDKVLSYMCARLNAPVASLYLYNNNKLGLLTSNAREGDQPPQEFHLKEGLIGQVAFNKAPQLIKDLPSNYIKIKSSLGQASPTDLYILPLINNNDLVGVLEIASLQAFTQLEIQFLNQGANNIAIAFVTANARSTVTKLLEESQQQGEVLLKTNKELERQTTALRLSEEELKSQQEELEAFNAELEEKTQLLEIQKKDLEDSQVEIEEKTHQLELTNQYKSEFLANMSHELRTPLNSLLLLSKMLVDNEDGNLTAEQVESASVIYSGGTDLLAIINDVLDLAKIEAGKKEVKVAPTSISEMIVQIERLFRPIAANKNLDFEVNLQPELPQRIDTDGLKVQQILKNLLSNAFKFTHEGFVKLHVRTAEKSRDEKFCAKNADDFLVFEVIDSGIGISKNDSMLVFEAFAQVDGTSSRMYGGTGLGLSISREYATMLGGAITLMTGPDAGSTFTLYIPKSTQHPSMLTNNSAIDTEYRIANIRAHSSYLSKSKSKQNTVNVKDISPQDRIILIVEDDDVFAKLLSELAAKNGFKPVIVSNGVAAVQQAISMKPIAIMLDIMLPGVDGWSVLRQLKDNILTRHIPVQLISAYENINNAVSEGAIGFIKKPVTKSQLVDVFYRFNELNQQKKRQVLVIENDVDALTNLKEFIENDNLGITGVNVSEEAITLLTKNKFDSVVLDLGTAGIDGLDLLDRAISTEKVVLPPIVLYTTRTLTDDEEKRVHHYSNRIAIRSAHTKERLLDEVTLFLHSVIESLPIKQQKIISNSHNQETVLAGKKVLLVDDDIRNIFAVTKLLQSKAMVVILAENGQQALDELAKNPDVQIVLMDIMMPIMDGYQAIVKIRSMEAYETLPILALTAKAMAQDRHKCIEAGASDYLAKPIENQRLLSMLRVWLQQ